MKHNLFKRLLSVVLAAACMTSVAVTNTASCVAVGVEASNAEPTKNEYQILSPVPSGSSIAPIEQPARLDSLKGKRIALVGGSFSASVTHQVIADMLEEEFGCITYYMTDRRRCCRCKL